ncbi:MAG: hypothetical protein LBP96_03580 [Bacteroidales bacterium]|jgi:hypothetical protein|nr:hypothetical protein [Bacteroidales bacterium]
MNYFNNELIMKLVAIIILLIALFLLYRIAYPKQSVEKKDNETLPEKPKSLPDVVGKSRFVLPHRSQPLQTPATSQDSEKEKEKPLTFAPESENNRSIAIPPERLDNAFLNKQNSDNSSLPPDVDTEDGTGIEVDDDDETDIDIEAEEAEELNRALGHEAVYADGIDYYDLQTVVKIVKEQPAEVSKKTADTITALEHTDMFELLASGDEGKMNWIKSIIERNIQKLLPETENENYGTTTDYGNFTADFLAMSINN